MKGKKRIRKSGTESKAPEKELYFGPDTHKAICLFNGTTDMQEREKIYTSDIRPAIETLVENLIRIYSVPLQHNSYNEVKSDCVNFLYENLCKFDDSRGTKAFSYFNVVARNWLFLYIRKINKHTGKHVSLSDMSLLSKKDKNEIARHSIVESPETVMVDVERKAEIRNILTRINHKLVDDNEKACMQAIMSVFEHVEDIDILHKRAILIYIRDLSNLPQNQLSSALGSIRRHYKKLVQEDLKK
jgi:hypothetical protein